MEELNFKSLIAKLKALNKPLILWGKYKFGDIAEKISKIKVVIHDLQHINDSRNLKASQGLLKSWKRKRNNEVSISVTQFVFLKTSDGKK